jgi:hypothetical protein
MMKRPGEPYIIINLALAGVIILMMVYSLIFSPDRDEYPVVCIHEKITGEECVSCGLSHSFSLIIRGRIDEAYRWNSYGMRIFIFFTAQLLMRITFSRIYFRNPSLRGNLILFDIIGSSVIFLIAFMPFLVWICRFC